jgi:hypothetical protein
VAGLAHVIPILDVGDEEAGVDGVDDLYGQGLVMNRLEVVVTYVEEVLAVEWS